MDCKLPDIAVKAVEFISESVELYINSVALLNPLLSERFAVKF